MSLFPLIHEDPPGEPGDTRDIIRRNAYRHLPHDLAEETVERFDRGLQKYGDNHLGTEYRWQQEALEEVLDCFNQVGIAQRRGECEGWQADAAMRLCMMLIDVVTAKSFEEVNELVAGVAGLTARLTD